MHKTYLVLVVSALVLVVAVVFVWNKGTGALPVATDSLGVATTTLPRPSEQAVPAKDSNVGTGATLDLSGQGLVKVPMTIFSSTALVELNLSRNSFEGSLPAEIRFLNNLKVLNLSHNKFTGVPAEIGQLENLEILDLSNNALTGLPHELGNLSRLQRLDLRGTTYAAADLAIIKKTLPSTTVVQTD